MLKIYVQEDGNKCLKIDLSFENCFGLFSFCGNVALQNANRNIMLETTERQKKTKLATKLQKNE